jgi:hypothetical protein
MKKTLFHISQDTFHTLGNAQSEAEVRQAVIAELPLGRLEYMGIDYLHDNLLIEFKLENDMSNREGKRAEFLAQACYYCHALRINGDRVPPYIALVDKNEAILFQRDKLEHIYKNEILFKEGNPSTPNVAVAKLCRRNEHVWKNTTVAKLRQEIKMWKL